MRSTDDVAGAAMPEEVELRPCSECGELELPEALSDCSRIAPLAGRCCDACVVKLVYGVEISDAA